MSKFSDFLYFSISSLQFVGVVTIGSSLPPSHPSNPLNTLNIFAQPVDLLQRYFFTKNFLLDSSSFLRFLGFKCFTNHPSISWYIIGLNQLQSVTIIFVGLMAMFIYFIVKSGDQMLLSGLLIT